MKIENSFAIEAPISDTWDMLTDIPVIAQCLPGAVLSGEEAGLHTGSVTFKVGPVAAEYRGSAEFIEQDELNRRVVIDSKASDLRGTGDAQALITADLTDHGTHTQVDISTHLQITGKVAQFGRGVVQDSSEKLFRQFATCLAAKLDNPDMAEVRAVAPAAASTPRGDDRTQSNESDNGEPLDLLHVAGRAVAKRVVPIAVIVVCIVVLLLILI